MAHTYKSPRTLESYRARQERPLDTSDARRERHEAREALRHLRVRLDNSMTLWQSYVSMPTLSATAQHENDPARGLQA